MSIVTCMYIPFLYEPSNRRNAPICILYRAYFKKSLKILLMNFVARFYTFDIDRQTMETLMALKLFTSVFIAIGYF